jgi:hypothetical protein
MAKAAKVLAAVAEHAPGQLPRYQSERSGAVFARLTDVQNHEFFRNRSLPLDGRLQLAAAYTAAANQVYMLYLTSFLKHATGDSELVELLGAQFRMAVLLLELVDEKLPTVRKDDPAYESRMAGLEKMKGGLAMMVAGGLQILTEKDSYRTAERMRMLAYMQETVPKIVPRLPAGARAELLVRLEGSATNEALKVLQPAFEQLHAAVRRAAEAARAP